MTDIKVICDIELHMLTIGDWPSKTTYLTGASEYRWVWSVCDINQHCIARLPDGSIGGCATSLVNRYDDPVLVNEPFSGQTLDREHAFAAARDAHAKVCHAKLGAPVDWTSHGR